MMKNNFFTQTIKHYLAVAIIFVATFSGAQTKLADWTVSGGGFTAAPTFTNGFAHATAVSSISISHNGYSAGPFNDQSYFVHHTNTASTLNTSTAPYTQFTVNLNTSSITFDKILVKFASAGAKLQLRWSVDGYASSLGEKTDADLIVDSYLFNLSTLSAVTANTVTFRLYSYAGSSNPSNLQFSDNHGSNPENITTTYLTGAKAINIFYSAATIISTPPTITSFSPTSGAVGSVVTITGTGFDPTPSNNVILLDGMRCTVSSATSTSLSVIIPKGTTNNYFQVVNVTNKLSAISKLKFSTKSLTLGAQVVANSFYLNTPTSLNNIVVTDVKNYSTADIDADGKLDILAMNNGYSLKIAATSSTPSNLNYSVSTITNAVLPVAGAVRYAQLRDFNNDGLLDFMTTEPGTSTTGGWVNINTSISGAPSFASRYTLTPSLSYNFLATDVVTADLNNDGKIDILGGYRTDSYFTFCKNNTSNGTFSEASSRGQGASQSNMVTSMIEGEFTGDSKVDYIVLHGSSIASVVTNNTTNGANSLTFSVSPDINLSANLLKSSDLDNDGDLDLIGSNIGGSSLFVLTNSGTGTFTISTITIPSGNLKGVELGDLDQDGDVDIIYASTSGFYFVPNSTSSSNNIIFNINSNIQLSNSVTNYGFKLVDLNEDDKFDILYSTGTGLNILINKIGQIPTISLSSSNLSAFSTCTSSASIAQRFKVSASNLTANVAIGALTGYEFSLDSSSYSSTVSIPFGSGTLTDVSVHVRLSNSATGTPTGNITLSSTGAVSQTVAVNGSVTTNQPFGNALALNGSGKIQFGNQTAAAVSTNFTIEAWVNVPSSAFSIQTILSNSPVPSSLPGFKLGINSWQTYDGKIILEGSNSFLSSTGAIAKNVWQHVAVVVNGTSVTFYINGVEAGSATGSFTATSSYPLTIGDFSGGSYPFNGSMDEVRLWNVSKSKQAIQAAIYGPLTGSESGLAAYFNFNQGTPGGTNTGIANLIENGPNSYTGSLSEITRTGTAENFVANTNAMAIIGSTACVGSTVQLYHPQSGGSWSSATTSVATINSSGLATCLTAGTSVISYTYTYNSCQFTDTYTMTVNATPVAPTVATTTFAYCQNASAPALTATAAANHTLRWYTVATGGTGSTTAITPVTSTAGTFTYYVAQANATGCDGPRVAITVTVSPTSVAGTVAAAATSICSGGTTTLSLTGNTGTVQWQSSPNNSSWTNISGATSTSYTTPALTSTTYYKAVVTSGSCASVNSNIVTISTIATSAVSQITGNSALCVGSTTTLSNTQAGGTWSSATTAVASINASGVVNTLSAGTSVVSYTIIDGNNCPASATITLTVADIPAAPSTLSATPTAACVGATVNLNATTNASGINWYTDSTGGTLVGSSLSTQNLSITAASNTPRYYAESYTTIVVGSQTINYSGAITTFTVPSGVTNLKIDTRGASGGNSGAKTGGNGARMVGDFTVTPGQVLKVLVGGTGSTGTWAAGGGGGTFVTDINNNPLCIAGGGGGAQSSAGLNGNPGLTSTSGGGTNGGTNGNGGGQQYASGGGGLLTNGTSSGNGGPGLSFLNGGAGGASCGSAGAGGFGGGSGGEWCYVGSAGAGGGYSGGGGNNGAGNGGGSFNNGTNQSNTQGFNTGNGSVVFSWNVGSCPSTSRSQLPITVNAIPVITGAQNMTVGGATLQLSATETPDATMPWASSNTAVATVSSTGVVTAVGAGSTTITYTTSGGCTTTAAIQVIDCAQPFGNALAFGQSTDFVQVNSSIFPSSNVTDFTIETWIKPSASDVVAGTPGNSWFGFLGSYNTLRNPSLWITNSGALHASWSQNGSNIGTPVSASTPSSLVADSWTHVALVKDGTTMRIYANGIQVNSATCSASITVPNNFYWLGKVDNQFNGALDEVRFWSTARTQSQLQNTMYTELVGNETGLLAYFNFNEGIAGGTNTSISTLTNKANNASNGTLTNFTKTGTSSNFVGSALTSFAISGDAIICANSTSQYTHPMSGGTWTISNGADASISSSGLVTTLENENVTVSYTYSLNGCSITDSKAVSINTPAAPTATTTVNLCEGVTAPALTATPSNGLILQWYTAATGGTASTTAPTPVTTSVGSTTYYVSQKANTGAFTIDNAAINSYANYVSNIGQTFTTSSNVKLTSITLKEAYFDYSNASTVLKVYNGVGGSLVATANSAYVNSYSGWLSGISFSFTNQNIILTAGQTYYFQIVSSSTIYPKYSNAYANGSGYINNSIISQDFAFKLESTIDASPCESPRTAITVNVNAVPTISGVQNMTVGGSTLQLTGSGTPDATTPWSSSNPAVATISSTGLVTAVGGGSTTLTYTVSNGCTATAVISVVDCSQPLGNVLHFDGVDDYFATASNISALNITANLTLETWIKFDQTHSDWVRLIGKGDANNRTYGLWLGTDGKLLFQINGTPTGLNFTSTTALQPGIWYHIAAVRNGSSAKILINGVEDATATTSVSPQTNTFPLTVGYGTLHTYLKGSLEDVRVWNIARSDSQIQQGMYNSVAGNETGLVAYYDFNQGIAGGNNSTITTAIDKTTNALNGTLTNFGKTGATSNFIGNSIINFAISGASIVCANSTSQFTHPRSGGTWSISNGASASINSSGLVTTLENENVTVSYTYPLNGCSITDSKSVSINTPAAPVVTSPVNLCQGVTATALTATASNGLILQWYATATGGTASTTAPTPSTSTVGTTTYYVSQKANAGAYSITTGNNGNLSTYTSNIGQSFQVANNVILNTITFDIIFFYSPAPVTLKIYNGFGGALIATANSVINPTGYSYNNNSQFSFSGQNLQLNAGQTYYMELTSPQNMYVGINSNVLSTGTAYFNGVAYSGVNLGFTLASTLNVNPCESPRTAITVNVNAIPTITGIQNMTVGGSTLQLTGSGTPNTTTPWSSSNTAVATISSTGEVTAVAGGTSVITYTTASGCSITTTVKVTDCAAPFGNALNFDGVNDYAVVDNVGNNANLSFSGTSNFTIESWVKRENTNGIAMIFSKYNGGVAGNYWLGIDATGKPIFSREASPWGVTAINALPVNEWHHIAATYDGAQTKIYVDGVLSNTTSAPLSINQNVSNIKVNIGAGLANNSPAYFFKGELDEIRVWNVARTATQIQQNFNTTLQGNETGLAAYYDFNQGIAGGNNTTVNAVVNAVNSASNGTLTNLAKNGTSSNFVGSTIANFPINGAASICAYSSAQFTHQISGGTWSLASGAAATISTSGLITTSVNESVTINYTYTMNGCSVTATKTVTVENPVISGLATVAAGEQITLTATTTPATNNAWVSTNTSKLSVTSAGVVTGLAPGTASVIYTNNLGCKDTLVVTVTVGTTVAPTLTSPATNTTGATTLNIVYSLPEAPLAGSVTLTFTPVGGGTPIVWTMNNATSANFNYVVGTNPISSTVTAGAALGFTTYNVTLAYQDAFANPAATVTNTNIQTLAPPIISFNNTSFATVVNSTLTINTINTGGSMVTYSIAPTLPTGFTFNTTTGVITGSSTVAISATTFTVTATNAAGTDTEPFSLAITADTDGDGIPDIADADVNGDGVIDNGPDTDGDGIIDQYDNDIDGDGIPNNLDNDADGDGVPNAQDVCSLIPNTAITVQPSTTSQVICPSASIGALTVTATGPGLSYQWYRNTTASTTGGTLLVGATNASYIPLNTVSGTVYYYVIVSGTCGNATSNVSGSILVTDVTLPTVLTQNRTIYLNTSGQATITAAQIDNGSTDNCAIATRTLSQTTFNCNNVGVNTVTLTVTDASGNIRTGNATVTVIDSIKPTVVTQNITVNLNASGQASITAAQINNGSSDNCGIASVTLNQTAFTCAHTGPNTVTLSVTDVNGNVKTKTAIVTVVDNILPTVVTQNVIRYLNASGQAIVSANDINNGSTDNCGIGTVALSQTAFTCAHVGVNTVTLTVTDTKGNSATGQATVTIIDNTPPTAIAQNINAYLNAGGAVTVAPSQVGGGSTDNCSIATMTLNNTTFNCSNLGANPVILTVVDPFNNVSTANAVITVVDSIKPLLTIPADITVNANSGCGAFGFPIGTASATDNCSVISAITNNAPSFYPVGITNIVYSVTDGSGNTKTKIQKVTVIDNVIPIITAPAAIATTLTTGCTKSGVNLGTPVTSDNCTIASVTNNAPTAFPVGTTTVTWTVIDASGNTATATQTVTVTDAINPTISAPANLTINANASCVAFGVALGTPVTADNCTVASITNNAPAVFPIGTTIVTWKVIDASGNFATSNQTVNVVDNTLPTLVAPAAITVNISNGCTISGVNLGTAVRFDNCTIASLTNNAPAVFPLGTTTVIWTVTDVAGNITTANQTVTVVDNINPTITAPAAKTVNTTTNCIATGVALGTPVTADNCSVASVTNNAPSVFPLGTTTITWTVTDGSGRTATATQTVTVVDNTNPTITAPAAISVTTNAGCTATGIVLGTPVTADNCTVASITNNAPAVFPIGTTIVTWKVIDASGNFATSNQTVNVVDNAAPLIFAPAAITLAITSGCTVANLALGTPVTMDNCSTLTVTNNAPTTFPIGITSVTWTVTDGAGNTATATQVVTIVDNTDPTIIAPAAVTANLTTGCTATGIALGTPTTADNCTVASVTNNAPVTYPIGTTIVTWTVTDGAGNTATTAQLVTITDNTNPTITAPAAISATTNAGCTATGIVLGTPVTADNCTVASVTNNAPTVFPIGTTTITWVVTDGAGNATTATQLVTITDAINPTITAPANITVNTNSGCTATGIALGSPITADNCSVVSVTNNAPTTFPIGTTTVSWVVTDGAGNTASTTQTVTVNDVQLPTITPPANVTQYVSSGCTVNGIVIGTPVTADNCTVSSVTNDAPGTFPIGTTTVTWIVTDGAGNTASATQLVTVIDTIAPVAQLIDATIALNANGTATLNYAAVNNGSYDNCGIASVELSQSLFSCDDLGTQTVIVTLTDSYGNSISQLIKVTVINSGIDIDLDGIDDACDDFVNTQIVQVPSGFSPNGDNINDTFIIPALDQFSSVHLQVYNKYGHEVYVSAQYNNDWNGSSSFNGMELPDDTYFYILTTDGELRQGFVYINRVK